MDKPEAVNLNIPAVNKPRVVVIGAGFGGINTVKQLRNKGFQVVLLDKHNYHTFQPLLYQVASAALQPDAIAGPLRNIFKKYGDFHFRTLKVLSVDPAANSISTAAGDLTYDYLVITHGTKTNYFGNPLMEKYSFPLKSIPDALNLRTQLMQVMELATLEPVAGKRKRLLSIVLVGGGPTGVETAGAIAELKKHVFPKDYPSLDLTEMTITLVEGMDRLLPTMSEQAGARAAKDLIKMGVTIKLNTMVDKYDGAMLTFKNKETINAGTVIWSAGVTSEGLPGLKPEWLEKGRILTDEHCRVKGSDNIFAIGDIALMKTGKYPKGHPGQAQVAIQMGKYVGKQLANPGDTNRKGFRYFDKGSLATIGRGKAVADLPPKIHLGGRIAWWIWLFVHIMYLVSFRNRLLVLTNWAWNYFTFDKGNRLIIRPYAGEDNAPLRELVLKNVPDEAQVVH